LKATTRFSNDHSVHLVEFLADGSVIPTFSFNPPDPSIGDSSDMIAKQVGMFNELDWISLQKDWEMFPYSLGFSLPRVTLFPKHAV
jgi:hypothetical protein